MRRAAPWLTVALAVLACLAASAPWLRAVPAGVIGPPLVGAAVVSVLLPILLHQPLRGRLYLTAPAGLVVFLPYALLAVLHSPTGFADLADGLWRGSSQLLTYSLPLADPPSLLLVPVALCWVSGVVAGESLARGWTSLVPFGGWLLVFTLAYAATQRAATHASGASLDAVLAGALLAVLLLLRAVQAWAGLDAQLQEDEEGSRRPGDPGSGGLPVRGLVTGVVVALLVAGVTVAAAPGSIAGRPAVAPQREPETRVSDPVTPLAYVAGLRSSPDRSRTVFTVDLQGPSTG